MTFITLKVGFRSWSWQHGCLKQSLNFERISFIQNPVIRFSYKFLHSKQLVTLIFLKQLITKLQQTVFEVFKKFAFMRNLIVSQNSFFQNIFLRFH